MKNLVKDDKCSLKINRCWWDLRLCLLILTSIEDLQIDDWWFSGRERGRCPAEWANVLDVRRCREEGGRRARSSNGRRAARDEARQPRRRSMNAARRRWSINVTSHRADESTDERCTDETIDHSRPTDGQRAAERRSRPAGVSAGRRQDARGTSRGGYSDDDDESLISGTGAHSQRHHHAARVWRETDGQRIAVS